MKKEFFIPESLHEVSLTDFSRTEGIVDRADSDVMFDSIQAILGIDKEILRRQKQKTIDELGLKVVNLLERDNVPVYTFNLKKVKYGMIPDLREGAMSYGEFIDLNNYIKRQDNDRSLDSMARFMAVLFRPIDKEVGHGQYSIKSYVSSEDYYKEMLTAPAAAYLGAESFFLSLRKTLVKDSAIYLKEAEEKYPQLGKNLTTTSDITGVWQEWQMGIISRLINLLKNHYSK